MKIMPVASLKKNLIALSFPEMEALVISLGWKKYRIEQILSWIYHQGIASIDQMTNISKTDQERLSDVAEIGHVRIVMRQEASDGTRKFLVELHDGHRIESVLIPDGDRLTLCISSQAGCTLDCNFCLTAQEGLKRNLMAHEMVDQVLIARGTLSDHQRITNIVLMGMGEPLANLNAVTEALKRMTSPWGFGMSPRKITVSTAGLVPQIRKFWKESVPVNLSISLNATTNEVRDRIMPAVNRLYPIENLLAVCKEFPLPVRRRITFEYVLLAGVNDSVEDARRLVKLTRGIRCKINLIPFNEFSGSPYCRPSDEQILQFQDVLHRAEITATIRKSKGNDILAACGQLNGVTPSRLLNSSH